MININIRQLQYIVAVSEQKSFEKAAEACFVTQSTLSTMVGRLEKELNIILFDRKTKPIEITKEGQEIIIQARTILQEMQNLEQIAGGLKGELTGKLKIAVIPTVAPFLLPLFLKEFIEKYTGIHFVFSERVTEVIIEELARRSIDIGILSTPINHPDLVAHPLYQEPFVLYDRSDDETPKEPFPISVSDIDVQKLWLLEEGHCLRTQIGKICAMDQQGSLNWNLEYRSSTIDTLKRFVTLNKGITLLPRLATTDFTRNEKGYLRNFVEPVPAREISLVVHKHFAKRKILEKMQASIARAVKPYFKKSLQTEIIAPE